MLIITGIAIAFIASFFYYFNQNNSVKDLPSSIYQQHISNSSNIYKLVHISMDNYSLDVKVPETTGSELYFSSGKNNDIRYSLYFENLKMGYRGYLQIWQSKDVESFVNLSKSLSPFDYKHYEVVKIQHNRQEGFQIKWAAAFGQKYISSIEYWIPIDNTYVIRVSFYADTLSLPDSLQNIIKDVLNSI